MTPTSHVGAVSLFALLAWSVKVYVDPSKSYVELTLPVVNLHVGGVLFIVIVTAVVGLLWMLWCELFTNRAFFRGDTMDDGLSLTDDHEVVRVRSDPR